MTISEIARLAGVSTSTVSRVFSHHPNIREDVRDRVFQVAREHGYRPRLTSRQKNVVIITPYNSDYPVHSCVDMLLMALTRELPARGFRIEILPHDNLARLAGIQFCGAVAIGAEPGDFREWSERFAPPLVIVDRRAEQLPPEDGCSIYYTWDGTDPTTASARYTEPFEVPEGNNVLSVLVVDKKTGLDSGVYRANFIYYP